MVGDSDTDERSLAASDLAVAHWHVRAWGGAEYVVTRLAETLGCGRVYTIGSPAPDDPNPYGDVEFVDVTEGLSLRPLRKLQARIGRVFEYALWEDVDWRRYGSPDILITSGATTRAVITPDETVHVNYCHSPPRWFYDLYHDRKNSLVGQVAKPLVRYLRMRDATVDPRVDRYFANSPIVARRIQKFYDRDSTVLYPPVNLEAYRSDGDKGFYLHLGRLDDEKGVPELVAAFAGTEHRLVLAGGRGNVDDGVMRRIKQSPNIEYCGFVSETKKHDLLATCRALIFNGHSEDFGIVPIEANASDKAVLTRDEGFPGIFVQDGENGLLHDGTVPAIRAAIKRFEISGIDGAPLGYVQQFSRDNFDAELWSHLSEWCAQHRPSL
jgi:glycosyltransferase involved in cell wall biosynthesis